MARSSDERESRRNEHEVADVYRGPSGQKGQEDAPDSASEPRPVKQR